MGDTETFFFFIIDFKGLRTKAGLLNPNAFHIPRILRERKTIMARGKYEQQESFEFIGQWNLLPEGESKLLELA